jgi:hypothetical protein
VILVIRARSSVFRTTLQTGVRLMICSCDGCPHNEACGICTEAADANSPSGSDCTGIRSASPVLGGEQFLFEDLRVS